MKLKKIALPVPTLAVISLTASSPYAHPATSCYTKLTIIKKTELPRLCRQNGA